ncbi:SPOR domain-containing protein [Aliikangiella sp. G2MR2-5]|uniref:SPOR domain-containing protein n=1 Tax=Aliikangiella sp. G2MR2-5 TaxID=2788943 RepID=UPI0018AC4540
MSYLKVYKDDLRRLMIFSAVLPVFCFTGGFWFGTTQSTGLTSSMNSQKTVKPEFKFSTAVVEKNNSGQIVKEEQKLAPSAAPKTRTELVVTSNEVEYSLSDSVELTESEARAVAETTSDKIEESDIVSVAENNIEDSKIEVAASSLVSADKTEYSSMKYSTAAEKLAPKNASLITNWKKVNDFYVQAGRFSSLHNAVNYQRLLEGKDISTQIAIDSTGNNEVFVIILASFDSQLEAKEYSLFAEELYQIDLFVKKQEAIDKQFKKRSVASL